MKCKSVVAAVLSLALALSMTGCGNETSNPTNAPSTQSPSSSQESSQPVLENAKISIVSAASGGAWYSIGGALAELFKTEIPGAVTECGPGGGISNVFTVSSGEAQLGFGFPNDVVDAENGAASFEGNQITNIRGVTALYPGILHIAVAADSNIETVEDLKGKVLCTQTKGNSAEQAMNIVLQACGMSYEDMGTVNYVGFTDAVDLVKDGHADAIAYMSTYPYAALQDLAESKGVKLLSLNEDQIAKIQEINSAYEAISIPGGTYKGTDEEVTCISAKTILFTSAEESDELVYAITKALYENYNYLCTVNSSLSNMTPDYGSNTGITLHPGAEAYYKEIGAIK